jgi:hypothetical protein
MLSKTWTDKMKYGDEEVEVEVRIEKQDPPGKMWYYIIAPVNDPNGESGKFLAPQDLFWTRREAIENAKHEIISGVHSYPGLGWCVNSNYLPQLISMANKLDQSGFYKEADEIDEILNKISRR